MRSHLEFCICRYKRFRIHTKNKNGNSDIKTFKAFKYDEFHLYFYNEEKNEIVFILELFFDGSLSQHLLEFKHPRLRVVKLWYREMLKGLRYLLEHVPLLYTGI